MVVLQLENRRFGDIVRAVPNSVEKIMDAPLICDLVRVVGGSVLQEFVEGELIRLAAQMNVAHNLQIHQKDFIAETLIGNYPTESLADFVLVFKRGAIGYYGADYHRLDAATIMDWMTKHIEEKAMYRERDATTAKKEEKLAEVDYEAFKKRLKQEAEKQLKDKETEVERRRAEAKAILDGYKPVSRERAIEAELTNRWIRANFDTQTGKRKPGYVEKEEWIKRHSK